MTFSIFKAISSRALNPKYFKLSQITHSLRSINSICGSEANSIDVCGSDPEGNSAPGSLQNRTLGSAPTFLPLQITERALSSETTERGDSGSGSLQISKSSQTTERGYAECCNSRHAVSSLQPRMPRSHSMPLLSMGNSRLIPSSNPVKLLATRSLVTFSPRERYEMQCYLCNNICLSGPQLLLHFRNQHPGLHEEASKLGLVCRCGSSYNDLGMYTLHTLDCPCVMWHKPPKGVVKVTTDGCCKKRPEKSKGPSAGGGIMRDSDGSSLAMFRKPLGICNSELAELISFCFGLGLVSLGNNHSKAILEIDSENVIGALKKCVSKKSQDNALKYVLRRSGHELYEYLLLEAKKKLEQPDIEFNIRPIYREANRVADRLANLALVENEFQIQSFDRMETSFAENLKSRVFDDTNKYFSEIYGPQAKLGLDQNVQAKYFSEIFGPQAKLGLDQNVQNQSVDQMKKYYSEIYKFIEEESKNTNDDEY